MSTVWESPARVPESEFRLASALQIHPWTARLLVNRGVRDVATAERFLNPSLDSLHDPFLLPNMTLAAETIANAVRSSHSISVHGDYDVDGVTSTTLFVRALRSLGAQVRHTIPSRQGDGYDIKPQHVDAAMESGAQLLITTDCGIKAFSALERAHTRYNVSVVVTDHHQPGDSLPVATAIVNPHLVGSVYPWPEICGCAVAFKTMQAVTRLLCPENEDSYLASFLDLVAFGTIADVMPLREENRVFVFHGLEALQKTRKTGLRMLIDSAGLDPDQAITAENVAFALAPRINAVGRLRDANIAADLLLTDDGWEALALLEQVTECNTLRKAIQNETLEEAKILVDLTLPVLVVSSPGWAHGIVGTIAGRLAELHNKPAFVISVSECGKYGVGSARSVPGYSVVDALTAANEFLSHSGGHAGAAGFSLEMHNLAALTAILCAQIPEVLEEEPVTRIVHDGVIPLSDLSLTLLHEWELLAPFGKGNPSPTVVVTADIKTAAPLGKDKTHMKATVVFQGQEFECVAWQQAEQIPDFKSKKRRTLLVSPKINTYRGKERLQLELMHYV